MLGFTQNVAVTLTNDLANGQAINSLDQRNDVVKQGLSFETGIMDNITTVAGASRVANLDVGAFSIGGTNLVAQLRGGSMTINNTLTEGSGVGDRWKNPVFAGRSVSGSCQLSILTSSALSLLATLDSSATAANLEFSLTINGVAITLPMVVSSFTHNFSLNELQIVTMNFEQRGAFTAAPATTTLLGSAITQPGVPLAASLTSRSSAGTAYSCNVLPASVSFDFNDSAIINARYNFQSVGAVTIS